METDRNFISKMRAFHPWIGIGPSALAVAMAVVVPVSTKAAWLAAAGSIVAVLGVLTLGRPVIRSGYAAWFAASQIIGGGRYDPTPAEKEEARQQALDAKAVQVAGPLLVVAGTLLNGFSGFF